MHIKYPITFLILTTAHTMTPITFDYLKNRPDLVETCARWSFGQWGHLTRNKTLEQYIQSRREYSNIDTLPLAIIAFDNLVPVGMCSLAPSKDIRPDLTPWLTTLFVVEQYRNKGVGTFLEKQICSIARKMQYKHIYCYTSDPQVIPWYQKQSWRIKEYAWHNDHQVTILEKDLK